jgi:phosphoribosylamine--glycine ligase
MKLLVVGSGGREHALVWKLRQSELVQEIYSAPGNGGTALMGKNVEIGPTAASELADFAMEKGVDLTVVGPEIPLVEGIVDEFEKRGLRCFGPSRKAARIEGDKAYAKRLLKKYGIPTPDFEVFTNREKAVDYLRGLSYPVVVKASGLAAGKGAIVVEDIETAARTVDSMMVERKFGDAGSRIVVEEYLRGQEASIVALTDGEEIVPLLPSQDHKPVFDGDRGPNTGGMGAYAPVPRVDGELLKEVEKRVLRPVVDGLRSEGVCYRGAIYAGLMLTAGGPQVLEFNCRFGDPETQAVLPLLKSDFVELAESVIEGRLKEVKVEWMDRHAACVVVTSGGYPESYEKNKKIDGIERAEGIADVILFHAGTRRVGEEFVTSGGRVLGVTGIGDTLKDAIEKTYEAVEQIQFEKIHYRKDIGLKGL